jgi:hypothetical protein
VTSAGFVGTPDEVGTVDALFVRSEGAFIAGSGPDGWRSYGSA